MDNFQGEENDIIILSLVRSNEDAVIGFLKIENRICVALSRAKHGFYLLGNMQNLKAGSKQWREIYEVLRSNCQIGKKFTLRCEVHNVSIDVSVKFKQKLKRKISSYFYLGGSRSRISTGGRLF